MRGAILVGALELSTLIQHDAIIKLDRVVKCSITNGTFHSPRKQPPDLVVLEPDRSARIALDADGSRSFSEGTRQALSYSERMLGIPRLLLRKELRTDAGKVFLDRYGEFIELSASGQLS